MEVRVLNVLLGIWLFASAFVWPRTAAQHVNTLVVGALCTLVALVAMRVQAARWINMVLAAWLFASVLILPRSGSFGLWNNLLAAIAMALVAGVRGFDRDLPTERMAT